MEILKLGLVKILNFLSFEEMLTFGWYFLLMLSRDSEDEMWSRFMFELLKWLQNATLARWTQSSGPLCLWQCLQKWSQSHKTGLGIGQRYSCWKGDTLNDSSNWLVNEVRLQLWCFALFPLDWPHPVHRQWLVIATKRWRWNAKRYCKTQQTENTKNA